MSWDFAECNPFSTSTWQLPDLAMVDWTAKAVQHLPAAGPGGEVLQRDARARVRTPTGAVISTDPPYYDNVPYADISDFFYVWMRKNLSQVWPDELSTLATPKAEELVADNYRSGSKQQAEKYSSRGWPSS